MQETEYGDVIGTREAQFQPCGFKQVPSSQHESRTEKLHGAYLAYTRRRTREPKAGKRGGTTVRGGKDGQGRKRRSGEEKNPGEETTAKKSSAPAADTRPAL